MRPAMVPYPRSRIGGVTSIAVGVLLIAGLRAAPTWTFASSAHFEVYTTAGDARARDALLYFERAHAFFASYLKLTPVQARPTRLIVFSNEKEFAPFRINEYATAFYRSSPERDYIVMRSLDPDSLGVVAHEYVHLIVRASGERLPVWLNEGLAEYFSTVAPESGKMSVGKVPLGRLQHISNGSSQLMPLEKLFAITRESPEYGTKTHAGTFYSQSWALTHMLMSDKRYQPQTARFLAAISGGAAAPAALESVYQRSTEVVFKDLLSYIRQDRFMYSLVEYTMPPQPAKPATRLVDAFEAGLVAANLLAGGRTSEGEARLAFETLAKERPDDLGLLESRGYFELRKGRTADAAPHLARAVELGSTNPMLLRDYAGLIAASDPAKAEELLAKALGLAPNDVETRVRLANVFVRTRKPDAAIATLAPVTQVPPDLAVNFFMAAANAAAQKSQFEDAKRAAARAVASARTENEKRVAAQLSASIQAFADRVAAAPSPGADTRSTLVIRDPAAPPSAPEPPAAKVTVAGRITAFDCNKPGVLQVTTATGALRLLVEDLNTLRIVSSGSGGSDIACGPQNSVVRVGYDPDTNAKLKTTGIVRVLDFRK